MSRASSQSIEFLKRLLELAREAAQAEKELRA
jgi:hypothetical protein